MNYFDIFVLIIFIVSAYGGYRKGFIKSIFSTIGYIVGGVLGLVTVLQYLSTWQSDFQKAALVLLAIFLGATVGEYLLGKIGSLFRKVLFVPPFKIIDSLVGAALSLIRAVFILSMIAILLDFSRWSFVEQHVNTSFSYQTLQSKLPLAVEFFDKQFG